MRTLPSLSVRVAHGILPSVLALASHLQKNGIRDPSVNRWNMVSALSMNRRRAFPTNRFRFCHHCKRIHTSQHNSHIFRTLDAIPRSRQHSTQENSRRLGVQTSCEPLCAHVELVTSITQTKEDSVLPSRFDSRHILRCPSPRKNTFHFHSQTQCSKSSN